MRIFSGSVYSKNQLITTHTCDTHTHVHVTQINACIHTEYCNTTSPLLG